MAIHVGVREKEQSWMELPLDAKRRCLAQGPGLPIADLCHRLERPQRSAGTPTVAVSQATVLRDPLCQQQRDTR